MPSGNVTNPTGTARKVLAPVRNTTRFRKPAMCQMKDCLGRNADFTAPLQLD
ncbi:hypothetical protein EMIT0158MI4_170014 [Burkholderia ambifaria]